MTETFAVPAVGAIIVKRVGDEEFILVQNRQKNNGDGTDGLLEIPAGKSESMRTSLRHYGAKCGRKRDYILRLYKGKI